MQDKKLYRYVYTGTSARTVCGETAHKPGDVINIPIKNYTHPLFKSMDGGANYPKQISQLKGKFKGKPCLLIGRGLSCRQLNYAKYKKHIRIAINPEKAILKSADPQIVIYLENNYSAFINQHLKLFEGRIVIGNKLALNCEHVDYFYGEKDFEYMHSSGAYGILIARLLGCGSISLIGYDYTGKEYNKKTFDMWLSDFKKIKLNNVIQLNNKSRLKIKTGGK